MVRRIVLIAPAMLMLALGLGCRSGSVSFAYVDDHPTRVRVYDVGAGHICNHDCHDHYWDGGRIVVLKSGHRHHRGCGHVWDGSHWVVGGSPAIRVHRGPQRVSKAVHVHSAACGCAWDRRERVWVSLQRGHTHGRNCGHIYINGKWCLPR